jgi:hypothetical protein
VARKLGGFDRRQQWAQSDQPRAVSAEPRISAYKQRMEAIRIEAIVPQDKVLKVSSALFEVGESVEVIVLRSGKTGTGEYLLRGAPLSVRRTF